MQLKWFGTASIELKNKMGRILFDPFVPLKGSKVDTKIEDFDCFDIIFVTHGHLDHIVNIPEIYKRNKNVKIYCTKTPYKTLSKKGIPKTNLILISANQEIIINGFKISTFQSKHARLPIQTLKQIYSYYHSPESYNIPFLLRENKLCKENGEILLYKVETEGKSIIILGSLNLCKNIIYPTNCDLLILPYNGWKNNLKPATRVIERLKPKLILLDHYDNTFPPLTKELNLSPILEKYNNIKVLEHKKIETL